MTIFSSCTQTSRSNLNPLLEREWETPFGVVPFEQVKAEHYLPAFELAFKEQRESVESIINNSESPTFESIIVALDRSGGRLRELRDLFEMSEAAISDDGYRKASEAIMPLLAAAEDSVYTDERLYDKVRELYLIRDDLSLTAEQMRLLELTHTRFVRGGALLNKGDKARLMEINAQIATLSSKFGQNLLQENNKNYIVVEKADLEGLSNDLCVAAKEEARRRGYGDNSWIFTLNETSYLPFITNADNREAREKIYKAYISRGANGEDSDNQDIVRQVAELRQQRAQLLGYANHAEYVISQQMAGSAEAAYGLLEAIYTPALSSAIEHREELQKLLEGEYPGSKLEPWDWRYYSDKLQKNRYNFNHENIAPFFSVGVVRGGAFTLANRLYGITFRPVNAPIYNEDCEVYEVRDRDNTHLGLLYFDLYPRSGKGQGAWCGNLREQSRGEDGERIDPVVAIVCNFPRPLGNTPSLLTLRQVETLFHEFGHALHFLFQDVDYRGLASVEGDFVEFPSQLMENWALDPALLRMYAVHYRTGNPISESMIEKIHESRAFNQGFETITVASAALLDLDLHTTTDLEEFSPLDFTESSLRERRELIPEIDPRYQLTNFPHLFMFNYSAGYYFYLWSAVLDKDCYAAFRESGDIFSKRLATKLRDEILSRGGEADGATLYRNFRGADPSPEWLLRSRGLETK